MRPVSRIAAPIRGFAYRFAYVGLVLGAFALMMLGKADEVLMEQVRAHVTDTVAPIMDALSRPVATVNDVVRQGRELVALREENARLRQERDHLLAWQAAGRRLQAENTALHDLLRFVPHGARGFVTARIVADTGGAFAHSLILNAGAEDGVRRGQAVITGEGLLGRIVGVGRHSARVLLVTDLNSRIPVVTETTRFRAILAGNNSNRPELEQVVPGAQVSPGDRIVTSGHGGVFPPGLPIGVVASVSDGGIMVKPFVAPSQVEYARTVDFRLDGAIVPAPSATPRSSGQAK